MQHGDHPVTALLVDDEWMPRKALLAGVDWNELGIARVLEAASARGARKYLEEEDVDLLITDIEMPGEDGMSLLRWVREEKKLDLPCAILTCHSSFPFAQEAIHLGCEDYLLKPIDPEELARVIRKMQKTRHREEEERIIAGYGRQYLQETRAEEAPQREEVGDADRVIAEQLVYIHAHLQEKLSLTELADRAGFHPNYYNRIFKERTGMPVKQYIAGERMKLAGQLLRRSDLKVYAIAKLTGYDSYAHFATMFRQYYGMTPEQYKKAKGGEEEV